MAQCNQIQGLKLDKVSLEAIERIKKHMNVANAISVLLSAGVFNAIFTQSSAPVVGYNIVQTDWDLYA